MIYVTSDLHFGHNKPFLYEPRGFSSIYEHDEEIIKRWNDMIEWNDDVYLLGDLMLGDNEYGSSCLRRLAGRKHLVYGNHDTELRKLIYFDLGIDLLGYAHQEKVSGLMFYFSHYPALTSNHGLNKPLKSRVISLCGHSHTKDRWADWDKGYIYHCELDAHDNRPKALGEIIEEIKRRDM